MEDKLVDYFTSNIKADEIPEYSKWIYSNISKFVGKRVLEIGAGTGTIASYYIDNCEYATITDYAELQIQYMKSKFEGRRNIEIIKFDLEDLDNEAVNEMKRALYDTLICINVLEHMENDEEIIKFFYDVMDKGAKVIIIVPAMSILFGSVDKVSGHYRRYDKGQLKRLAEKVGFSILSDIHMNLLGTFLWFIKGKVFKETKTYSETINSKSLWIYNLAFKTVKFFEKIVRVPWGLSEVIILSK
jgi:2-polyprenyl-3-methyl-5-hydroxy-6-metoxy-1,4-benzoquinol methylase